MFISHGLGLTCQTKNSRAIFFSLFRVSDNPKGDARGMRSIPLASLKPAGGVGGGLERPDFDKNVFA